MRSGTNELACSAVEESRERTLERLDRPRELRLRSRHVALRDHLDGGVDLEITSVGSRVSIEGESATAKVRRTGRPARMDDYESADGPLAEIARATGLRASVSAPITVEGRLWGLITASWKGEESPPPDTEERMVKFTGLLDTAIANADSRDQLTASRARLLTTADDARRRVARESTTVRNSGLCTPS